MITYKRWLLHVFMSTPVKKSWTPFDQSYSHKITYMHKWCNLWLGRMTRVCIFKWPTKIKVLIIQGLSNGWWQSCCLCFPLLWKLLAQLPSLFFLNCTHKQNKNCWKTLPYIFSVKMLIISYANYFMLAFLCYDLMSFIAFKCVAYQRMISWLSFQDTQYTM